MKTASEILARMPAERRAKIAARAKDLIAEEMTLQDLRKAQKFTQEQMAAALALLAAFPAWPVTFGELPLVVGTGVVAPLVLGAWRCVRGERARDAAAPWRRRAPW